MNRRSFREPESSVEPACAGWQTVGAALGLVLGALLISLPLIRLGWHPVLAGLTGLGLNMLGLFALAAVHSGVAYLRRARYRLRSGDRVQVLHGPQSGRRGTVVTLLPGGGVSVILDEGDSWDPPLDFPLPEQLQREVQPVLRK